MNDVGPIFEEDPQWDFITQKEDKATEIDMSYSRCMKNEAMNDFLRPNAISSEGVREGFTFFEEKLSPQL